jgi:hypothetical protein
MKKTSLTHPLQIAVVAAGPEFGRIITQEFLGINALNRCRSCVEARHFRRVFGAHASKATSETVKSGNPRTEVVE